MSASTPTTSSTSVYATPAFWERLWRSSGVQSVGLFIIAYVIYGYQPHVGASTEALVAFYDGNRMRILIAAVFSGLAILNLMWFAAALRTTLADAGQDGWGAAATASSAALGGLFLLLITVGRRPRILDRWLRKFHAHIGAERLCMGQRCVEFIPARDADHGGGVWPLAGEADLERALRGGGRSRRTRLARRHHLVERRFLGTGRRLFAVRLTRHRRRVGPGREPSSPDPKSSFARRMVIRRSDGRRQAGKRITDTGDAND